MSAQLTYPGVYIEEIPSGVRTIAGVATSVTAFVGRTRKGPINEPVVITTFSDFERAFGGLWDDSPLSYAVQDFYQVRDTLKTPYRDGTTHIVLGPLDLMARLAALVPPPRMHLTRLHGVFAPHSKLRAAVTPARRGLGAAKQPGHLSEALPPTPRPVAMSWARRLKRVLGIDIESCARCGGPLKIVASIEEPQVIAKILAHLQRMAVEPHQSELPLGARAPPIPSSLI